MFFAHHVEASGDRRVDADREIVVDDVARYRVAFFVPVIVPVDGGIVVVAGVGRWRWRRLGGVGMFVAVGNAQR